MAELRRPATAVRIKRMKEAYTAFLADQQIAPLVASLQALLDANAETSTSPAPATPPLKREDLRLICFDHIVS